MSIIDKILETYLDAVVGNELRNNKVLIVCNKRIYEILEEEINQITPEEWGTVDLSIGYIQLNGITFEVQVDNDINGIKIYQLIKEIEV